MERVNSENKLNSLKLNTISYDDYEKESKNDLIKNCYGLK